MTLLRMRILLQLCLGVPERMMFSDFTADLGYGRGLTPHMLTGFPSASRGVRFLLNFFPPVSV